METPDGPVKVFDADVRSVPEMGSFISWRVGESEQEFFGEVVTVKRSYIIEPGEYQPNTTREAINVVFRLI
jgi:hypothetical protein